MDEYWCVGKRTNEYCGRSMMVSTKDRARRRRGPGGAPHDHPSPARGGLPRETTAPPPPDGPSDDTTVRTSNRSADGGRGRCPPASLGPDGSDHDECDESGRGDEGMEVVIDLPDSVATEASRILSGRTSDRGKDSGGGGCDPSGARTSGLWIKTGGQPMSSDACAVITPSTVGSGDGSKATGYARVPPHPHRQDKVITNIGKMEEDLSALRGLAAIHTDDDDSADSIEYLLAWCGGIADNPED